MGEYAYNPSRINVGSIARLDDWEIGVLSPMYVVFNLDGTNINSDLFFALAFILMRQNNVSKTAHKVVCEKLWSFEDLGAIPIPLPSMEIQRKIASKLNTVKQEIVLLKQLAEKYRTQKGGLMKKLLTGEWTVAT